MYAAEVAHSDPHRVAVTMASSGRDLTYGRLEARANQLAHYFRSQGLRRGDHVAFVLENHVDYFELMAAAERSGLYYTCVSPKLTTDELTYLLGDSTSQVVIGSPQARERLIAAAPALVGVSAFLEIEDGNPAAPISSYEEAIRDQPIVPISDEQLGTAMLYSSGTTGRPKGVKRPLPDGHPRDALPVFEFVSRELFRMRAGMVYLAPAPMHHSAPQSAMSACIRLGAHAIVMESFDPVQWLVMVETHRVTHTQLVPTMLRRLVRLPAKVRDRYDLSSLEAVVHAAAPCPPDLKRAVIGWLGPIVWEYYASTEAVGATVISTSEWFEHPGSVGKPVLGALQIRDATGAVSAEGEIGRVWFGGAANFEYFNAPEKTGEAKDGGGAMVGDIGYVDADGYLYLTDRESFTIVRGGVNIYPQEIEDVLAQHECVSDVAVFGVPDADLGERVHAVVVLVEGAAAPALEESLLQYCRTRLASIKCPPSIEFAVSLPRTDTGKLLKATLRNRYR